MPEMRIQQDHKVRVVACDNLRAMCAEISGMAHRYEVTRLTPHRVYVTYDNPDEWGFTHPITVAFPSYPQPKVWDPDGDNPNVVLDAVRYIGCPEHEDPYQLFYPLWSCPVLRRTGPEAKWVADEEEVTSA